MLPKELTEEHREKLGSRAGILPRQAVQHFVELREGGWAGGTPPWFLDLEQCLEECTWGAAYVAPYPGARPCLSCTNKECYDRKLAAGREAFSGQVERLKSDEHQRGEQLILALGHLMNEAMARMVMAAISEWDTLRQDDSLRRRRPGGAGSTTDFDYYPDYLITNLAGIGVTPEDRGTARGERLLLHRIREKALSSHGEALVRAAAALLVYRSRADELANPQG